MKKNIYVRTCCGFIIIFVISVQTEEPHEAAETEEQASQHLSRYYVPRTSRVDHLLSFKHARKHILKKKSKGLKCCACNKCAVPFAIVAVVVVVVREAWISFLVSISCSASCECLAWSLSSIFLFLFFFFFSFLLFVFFRFLISI